MEKPSEVITVHSLRLLMDYLRILLEAKWPISILCWPNTGSNFRSGQGHPSAFESLQFEAEVSCLDLELMKVKIKGEALASLLSHGLSLEDALQFLLKKLKC